jgi:chromate transporter
MPNHSPALPRRDPSIRELFAGFASIGLMSFGGGLAAWTRREVVQRRGWLDDPQFLAGYALSQLVPGATNVNLAVFIGTQLRGLPGGLAALAGLVALPLGIVLAIGALYLRMQGMPGSAWFSGALAGMGAVAIGLSLGTGIQLGRRNVSRLGPALISAVVAISIGLIGFRLLHVLAVMVPVSLGLAAWQRPR